VFAFEFERGLEVALDRADEPFDFALAPGVVGLGVEEQDAEIGADDAHVGVDEGLALVGVELEREPAAQDGLLEAMQAMRDPLLTCPFVFIIARP